MIGFFRQSNTILTGETVALDPVNLKPTKTVDFNVTALLDVLHSNPNNPQTLFQIPILSPYGTSEGYQYGSSGPTVIIQANDLEKLQVNMTDEYGKDLYLPPNASVLIHLVLYPYSTS